FYGFQFSGTWGARAPRMPPEAPAPGPAGSTTRTRAPWRVSVQAQARPNTPAPRTVTSILAIPPPFADSSRAVLGDRRDVDQNGVEWRASIEWREGGVPVSRRFDDPYFS